MGSKVRGSYATVDGVAADLGELRPARALALASVVATAAVLGLMPAAIVLGVARLQIEQLAAGLGSLAAVVGGMKLLAAASGIAGRLWAGHTARLATTYAD